MYSKQERICQKCVGESGPIRVSAVDLDKHSAAIHSSPVSPEQIEKEEGFSHLERSAEQSGATCKV